VNPAHLFLGTHKENALDRDLKGRNNPRRGELHPGFRITHDTVESIKHLYESGLNQYEVAEKVGLHQSTVSRIISGKKRFSKAKGVSV
jgi:predicted XRE-type DNA-binding protein